MKIRSQLILALLLLAVLPLAGIVVYSYVSSRRAVRETVRAEAQQLTADMDRRLTAVKADLEQRMNRLDGLSFAELAGTDRPDAEGAERRLVDRWLSELGNAAPLVDSFEVIPVAPSPPIAGGPAAGAAVPDVVAPLAPVAPITPPELEAILLKVEHGAHDEIRQGLQHGIDIARAVAKAIRPLAAGPVPEVEAEAGGQHEGNSAMVEDDRAQPARWQLWVQNLEREAERARRIATSEERDEAQRRLLAEQQRHTELVLGRELGFAIREGGAAVGRVKPHLSARRLLAEVLRNTRRDQGELPFALDAEDRLYVADEADRGTLEHLPVGGSTNVSTPEDWVLVELKDSETGLRFGIARPIGETLAAVDRAARRNLAYGLSLIGLALGGVLLLSTRMTRNLKTLTDGAERITAGDLQTRVPVRSRDELGHLASAFNRMAGELSRHQERLLTEERRRRRKEIEQQILEADNARKTHELEEARQFQLSLLPKSLPEHPAFELAVHMETATEVGGDYYDFRLTENGTLVAAIGDATGHGARAGTMVTVIKSLFSAASLEASLGDFLESAARAIQRMDLGRMNMALLLAELRGRTLTVAAAGMPPPLLHRAASSTVEEISLPGLPLGTFATYYPEQTLELSRGDTVLLLSDGLPELPDGGSELLGYARVRELFAAAAARAPREIIAELTAAVAERTGGGKPSDDVTFIVLRVH